MNMIPLGFGMGVRSFRGYLVGRKKAGIVKLEQGRSLYLLPRAGGARVSGETMLVLLRQAEHPGDGGPPKLKVGGMMRQRVLRCLSCVLWSVHPDGSHRNDRNSRSRLHFR